MVIRHSVFFATKLLIGLGIVNVLVAASLAQTLLEQKIVFKVNDKACSIYDPLNIKNNDTVTGHFRVTLRNNTGDQRYVYLCMVSLVDGKYTGGSSSGRQLMPGDDALFNRDLSDHLVSQGKGKTIEIRWFVKHEPAPKISREMAPHKIIEYRDCINSCGRIFLNRTPVDLETLASQLPDTVEHDANWLNLGKPEILDAIYYRKRKGFIQDTSKLAKAMNEAGIDYARLFRNGSDERYSKDIDYAKESLALSAAKEKQWQAVEQAIEPNELKASIQAAIQRRFVNTHLVDQPGDVACLTHPKVQELINLNAGQMEKIRELSEALSNKHRELVKEFDIELPAWRAKNRPQGKANTAEARENYKERQNAMVDAHVNRINQLKSEAFNSMLELLSGQQTEKYKKFTGLDGPVAYQFAGRIY